MQLELDDTIIQNTGLTDDQLRVELALQLYQDGKLSLGQGGTLSGLGVIRFQQELGKRKIFLAYSMEDLQHDIDVLQITGQL
jgi:predicted HTH domain antitoxin